MALTFDHVTHRYWIDDQLAPSVTGILEAAGLISPFCKRDDARLRGRLVHGFAQDIDLGGGFDPLYAPADVVPFVRAYERFLVLARPTWEHVELPIGGLLPAFGLPHPVLLAGRVDRIGTLQGRATIADLKTGDPEPWHGLQLALYDVLAPGFAGVGARRRVGIYLRASETFKQVPYDNPADYPRAIRLAVEHAAAPGAFAHLEDL